MGSVHLVRQSSPLLEAAFLSAILLQIIVFPALSTPHLPLILGCLLSAQFGEAPVVCQLLCPVSLILPAAQYYLPSLSLILQTFIKLLVYIRLMRYSKKNGQKSLMN